MNRTAAMTSKGQITIPQAIRLALGLESGTRLSFELLEGELRVRPLRTKTWSDLWRTADGAPGKAITVDVKAAIQQSVKVRSRR